MRGVVIVALVACGTPATRTPAPMPVTAPPEASLAADPAAEPAPLPTPVAASYAGAACADRVAAMERSFDEARAIEDRNRENMNLPLATSIDGVGVDVAEPILSVTVQVGGHSRIRVGDKELRFDRDRWLAQTLAVVRARRHTGFIDLWLNVYDDASALVPLIEGLAALGTLRLRVRREIRPLVEGILDRLPAAASATIEAARGSATSLGVAIRQANGSCVAMREAFDTSQMEGGGIADEILRRVPAAVLACDCAAIDVDALEGLLVVMTAFRSHEVAWLQIRVVPGGTVVPVEPRVGQLVRALSELTPEQRAAGIQFSAP